MFYKIRKLFDQTNLRMLRAQLEETAKQWHTMGIILAHAGYEEMSRQCFTNSAKCLQADRDPNENSR